MSSRPLVTLAPSKAWACQCFPLDIACHRAAFVLSSSEAQAAIEPDVGAHATRKKYSHVQRASYSGCVCLHPVVAACVRSGRPCLQAWCSNAIVERWQNNADFVTLRLSSALDERTRRLPIALQNITVRVSGALAVCRSRSPIAHCLSPMHSASNAYVKCTRQDSGASVDCTR